MAARRRGSIRLWQTGLFVIVIVVAILILSGSLSAGLQDTLTHMAETNELRNASALVQRLEPLFPLKVAGTGPVREAVAEYRDIYGGGIWVYDEDGDLLEAAFDTAPLDAVLEAARIGALDERDPYASSDLRPNGLVVASKPLHARDGELAGVVVTASPADFAVAVLRAVRDRLWTTFWISLAVAGLLGFGFSELIGRRITALSSAAAAMAAGDFEQRLTARLVPGEIHDMAESFNSMAATLGEAFEATEEGRRQVAAVVESMAEGVLALDQAGIIRVMNPEAARLLSLAGQDPVGRPVSETTTDERLLDMIGRSLAGDSNAATISLDQLVILVHCTPLLGAVGEVEGAVVLLSDVTEKSRVEEAQRRFVADASHELRTPVAALKGMLELLVDGAKEVPAVRDDFLDTMAGEVDRLGRLVADLLTLAQLEAGSLRLKTAPEYIADLMEDVVRVMQTLAEHAQVEVVVEVADRDIRVMADRDRIVQVLLSFTDNALKHAPAGSTIRLRATSLDGVVALEVIDEGPGMNAEEIARVFERFYRADSSRAGGMGAGLGLAIAKEIVEAHGSAIIVRSEPGAGAVFGFELPAA